MASTILGRFKIPIISAILLIVIVSSVLVYSSYLQNTKVISQPTSEPTATVIIPKPTATPTPSVTLTYWEVNRTFTSNATAIFVDWTLGGSSVSYNPNEFYLVDKGVRISAGPSYTIYPYTTKQYPILDLVVDGIYSGNSYQLANDYIFQVGNSHPVEVNWVKK